MWEAMWMVSQMDKDNIPGQMVLFMLEDLKMAWNTAMVDGDDIKKTHLINMKENI